MGFPRQEYWSEWPFPSSGDLPNPGIQPMPPALTGGFFTPEPPGKPIQIVPLYKLYKYTNYIFIICTWSILVCSLKYFSSLLSIFLIFFSVEFVLSLKPPICRFQFCDYILSDVMVFPYSFQFTFFFHNILIIKTYFCEISTCDKHFSKFYIPSILFILKRRNKLNLDNK